MNTAQFQIFVKEVKSEMKSDAWMRENGIVPKRLQELALEVQKAQMIAKNLLTQHGNLMTKEQIEVVQRFYRTSHSCPTRGKPTKTLCLQVMNIGAAVNRKKFKSDRQRKRRG